MQKKTKEEIKDLIIELLKKHPKYPGIEPIIEDIAEDAYTHATVVINSVTNEDVIHSYLNKVISTSIITVSKKLNFKKTSQSDTLIKNSLTNEQSEKTSIQEIQKNVVTENEVIETIPDKVVIDEKKVNIEYVDKLINGADTLELAKEQDLVENIEITEESNESTIETFEIEEETEELPVEKIDLSADQEFNVIDEIEESSIEDVNNDIEYIPDNKNQDFDNEDINNFDNGGDEDEFFSEESFLDETINTLSNNETILEESLDDSEIENTPQDETPTNIPSYTDNTILEENPEDSVDLITESNETEFIDIFKEEEDFQSSEKEEKETLEFKTDINTQNFDSITDNNEISIEFTPPNYEKFKYNVDETDSIDYSDYVDDLKRSLNILYKKYEPIDVYKLYELKYKNNTSVKEIANILNTEVEIVIEILDNIIKTVEDY